MATLTNRTIKSTYGQLIQLEDRDFQDGFGESTLSGSYELVGDQNITGSLFMSGNFHLNGTASIDYLVASYESASIIFSSGSTKFGDTLDDTHEFTGSITSTGSFYGMAVSGNFTGSGEGLYDIPSASRADRATSASISDLASTASHALASSNLNITSEESSAAGHYLLFAQSNTGGAAVKTDSGLTYVPLTDTLSVTKVIGNLEGTATNAETASLLLGSVENAINCQTASLAISTSVINVTSQSFAASGDGPFTGSFSSSFASFLSGSFTGSYTGSLTGSLLGDVIGNLVGTASIADLAITASYTAGTASIADLATTASQADRATSASIADLAIIGSGSFSGSFEGDGTGLTGIPGYTVANTGTNRVVTSVAAVNGNAEANLTFDGTTLTILGNINTGQGVTEIYRMNQDVRTTDDVSFTSITETSALKYKENVESLDSGKILYSLRPVTFDWKSTGEKDYGLIAEEVNEHLPELVKKDENGEVEGIKYSKLTSLLIKVVQDQQSKINSLENDIKWIKNRL